jgi:hypothetical protein
MSACEVFLGVSPIRESKTFSDLWVMVEKERQAYREE